MKIKLHEIPEEGREYFFNRATGELNLALKDLIENAPYEAKVFVKPLNSKNYDITGYVKTSTNEVCSHCGDTFQFKIETPMHEILIPGAEEIKNSQFSKSNHVSELKQDGPGVSEYFGDAFDLGEYVHEAIALTVPYNPRHPKNDSACKLGYKSDNPEVFVYDEKMGEEKKNEAFDVLKGLKLN